MICNPRYDWAARAAAQIINLADPAAPRSVEFGRILFIVLDAMYAAQAELSQQEPSVN